MSYVLRLTITLFYAIKQCITAHTPKSHILHKLASSFEKVDLFDPVLPAVAETAFCFSKSVSGAQSQSHRSIFLLVWCGIWSEHNCLNVFEAATHKASPIIILCSVVKMCLCFSSYTYTQCFHGFQRRHRVSCYIMFATNFPHDLMKVPSAFALQARFQS